MKLLTKFVFKTILGWKVVGSFPKDVKKYVLIGAPHTHWKDFFLGLAIKWGEKVPANYIAKASLFKPPFGFILKWLGGVPIDRSKSDNKVQSIIEMFNDREQFILAISPEGTRQKVTKWKTGFYYIAKGADVPIVMMTFNFKDKEVKISEPYYTTDNMEEDFNVFYKFYEGVIGKIPKYS